MTHLLAQGDSYSANTLSPEQWSVGVNVFFDPTPYVIAAALLVATVGVVVWLGKKFA